MDKMHQAIEKVLKRLQKEGHIESVVPVSGGLLHKMYHVKCPTEAFAIKLLNKEIMKRPEARGNYYRAEGLARLAKEKGYPAIPAYDEEGETIFHEDGLYFQVFPWQEGKVVKPHQVTRTQAFEMGRLLKAIHQLQVPVEGEKPEHGQPAWDDLVAQSEEMGMPYRHDFAKHLTTLKQLSQGIEQGREKFPKELLSHRDLDPKNVLWQEGQPYIIDWEAAGPVHPMVEYIDTALYWSCQGVALDCLHAFKKGYGGSFDHEDWTLAYLQSLEGRIGWLVYNVKRSMGLLEASDEERHIATDEVKESIKDLVKLAQDKSLLISRLKE